MQLTVKTQCGPIVTTDLEQEPVDEFINEYRNGTARALLIPDSEPDERAFVSRDAILAVFTGPDVEVPEDPEAPEGAVDAGAPEESGTV